MLRRRTLLKAALGAAAGAVASASSSAEQPAAPRGVSLTAALRDEDVFSYLRRTTGAFRCPALQANPRRRQSVQGRRPDRRRRRRGRRLARNGPHAAGATRGSSRLDAHPPLEDELFRLLRQSLDPAGRRTRPPALTLGELKQLLLDAAEAAIRRAHAGAVERRDRLRGQAAERRGADRRRPEDLQSAARQPDRREGLSRRSHPAELADRQRQRHPVAGV